MADDPASDRARLAALVPVGTFSVEATSPSVPGAHCTAAHPVTVTAGRTTRVAIYCQIS